MSLSPRIKSALKGALAAPFISVVVGALLYVGAFYPQPFPLSLNERLRWIAPLLLLLFAIIGAWAGHGLADSTSTENKRALAGIAAYLVASLVLFSLFQRLEFFSGDHLADNALTFVISMASLFCCFAVQMKLSRRKN